MGIVRELHTSLVVAYWLCAWRLWKCSVQSIYVVGVIKGQKRKLYDLFNDTPI